MRAPLAAGLAVALTTLLAAAPAPAAVPRAAAPASARSITDAYGRALILHGMSTASSAKGPDGLPWITRSDVAAEARDLGSDVVRYLVQWKNVEPRPGRYDDRYLDAVARRVGWYREQGIRVILDMHQDLWGPATTGNGAPTWATYTEGLPTVPQDPWLYTYLQPGVTRAFDNFWNTTGRHPELAVRYARMFRHVARRFAHDRTVLGYDLMNEPWGGSTQGAAFEGPVLAPFYQRVLDAIREVDRDHWVFVEPQANGVNWGDPTWLGRIADPRPGAPRVVYAPHEYPLSLDLGGGYTGTNKADVQAQMARWRTSTTEAAARLGMPVWLGEFGGITTDAMPGGASYLNDTMTQADDMTIGYAFWSDDRSPDGARNADGTWNTAGHLLMRPYPRAIAGVPRTIAYETATRTLRVSWTERRGVRGATEIWLPPTTYPAHPKVTAEPGTHTTWNPHSRVLTLHVPHAQEHTVTVQP